MLIIIVQPFQYKIYIRGGWPSFKGSKTNFKAGGFEKEKLEFNIQGKGSVFE